MHGDGDGWVECDLGHRHWGHHGAAGLMLTEPGRVVLQHRATRTHEGDTWGLPGGARDSHEDVVETALREAHEEAAIDATAVAPMGLAVVDDGGWSYTTVVASTTGPVQPHAANWESSEVRWCTLDEVDHLPLHPGFAQSWPALRSVPEPLTVVVDMANVVGSRPDGWWRDRPAANAALRDRITALARRGIPAAARPGGVAAGPLATLLPRWILVVEGAAARVAPNPTAHWWQRQVTIVAAPGSGDDEIAAQAAALTTGEDGAGAAAVVTADRGLRDRLGTVPSVGPRWLLELAEAGLTDGGLTGGGLADPGLTDAEQR